MQKKGKPAPGPGCPKLFKPIPRRGESLTIVVAEYNDNLKHDPLHTAFTICPKVPSAPIIISEEIPKTSFKKSFVPQKYASYFNKDKVKKTHVTPMRVFDRCRKIDDVRRKLSEERRKNQQANKLKRKSHTKLEHHHHYTYEAPKENISLNTTSISLKCLEEVKDTGPKQALLTKNKRPIEKLETIQSINSEDEENTKGSLVIMPKNEANMKSFLGKSMPKAKIQYPIATILSPVREKEEVIIENAPLEMIYFFVAQLLEECSITEENLKGILDKFYFMRYKLPEEIQKNVDKKMLKIKAEIKERSYRKVSLKKDGEEKKGNALIFQKSEEETKKEEKNQSPKKNGEKDSNKKSLEFHSKRPKNLSTFEVSNFNENLPENIIPANKGKDMPIMEKVQVSVINLSDNKGDKEKEPPKSSQNLILPTKLNPPGKECPDLKKKKQADQEEEEKVHIPPPKHAYPSKTIFDNDNSSSSKKKEESKEDKVPFAMVTNPPKETTKKHDANSNKVCILKPIVTEKPENKEQSPQKESKMPIQQQIDPHPKNPIIPMIPPQTIPEAPQQIESQPSSTNPPHMGQNLSNSIQQLSHIAENDASLPDLNNINSNENPHINIDIMNAKLEEPISINNLSNGNEISTIPNSDMNTSQIISRLEDRHEISQNSMDFSRIQPSTTFTQIIENHQKNPFLHMDQNITTNIPSHLQNIFTPNAMSNLPNPLNMNSFNTLQNFATNPPIFPQHQHPNHFINNHPQNFNPHPMNHQNHAFLNPHHSQSEATDYRFHNQQPQPQPNNFVQPQNEQDFLEPTNSFENPGNIHEISFGHGHAPEIQMPVINNNNMYGQRMMPNQNNQQFFNGNFAQNNMNVHQNMYPNNMQNNQMLGMGGQSEFFTQNYNNQIDNARSMFSKKPENNTLNHQPMTAQNLFAPHQQNKNVQTTGDATQDRILNKKNDNNKLRANNMKF